MGSGKRRYFRTAWILICRVLGDIPKIIEAIIRPWPGVSGYVVRRFWYRMRFKHLGKRVRIEPNAYFFGHGRISIGDDTQIDIGTIIAAGPSTQGKAEVHKINNPYFTLSEGEVSIGKGVHVTAGVAILGSSGVQIGDYCGLAGGTRLISTTRHHSSYKDRSRRDIYFSQGFQEHGCYLCGPIVLGDNVGVASNAVLLPGSAVLKESFLAIGAVLRQGQVIAENSIAAGAPAERVGDRFRDTQISSRDGHRRGSCEERG